MSLKSIIKKHILIGETMNAPDFKDTKETAKILGIKKGTLDIWRHQGKGPQFHKIGRLVRYSTADIETFLNKSHRVSTSDTGGCLAGTQK
jgi:predicted DNA-binding transcriptional regulator AlpA